MRNHLLTIVLAAGVLVALAGSARARETQLGGIKLGAPTSTILESPDYGDPNRISPIFNLFRPPEQAAGGGEGGSAGGGEMGTENASQFLQLLGHGTGGASTAGGGEGGGMMGPGMSGGYGSMSGGYGSSEGGSGSMGGPLSPALVRPKQTYRARIANTPPEIYASWILIPPKMRTIIMMGMAMAMGSAGVQAGAGGSGEGMAMGSGGPMMGGETSGSGPGGMGVAPMSLSMAAVAKIPGSPMGGGMGGGGGGGAAPGGSEEAQPIATAWVYEKPADGMTYLFFADGGRVSLIAAGEDIPYAITKGGRKPIPEHIRQRIVTSKGITLGDPYDKVILTYGWPEATETMGDEIVLRYFGRQGVAFSMKQGVLRVDSIVVKLPGE